MRERGRLRVKDVRLRVKAEDELSWFWTFGAGFRAQSPKRGRIAQVPSIVGAREAWIQKDTSGLSRCNESFVMTSYSLIIVGQYYDEPMHIEPCRKCK